MTVAIVDGFEVVDVDKEGGPVLELDFGINHVDHRRMKERAAVQQAGQRVLTRC